MIATAPAALPSRSVPSVNRRNSAAPPRRRGRPWGTAARAPGPRARAVGPEKSISASSGSPPSRGHGRLVAQQLDELGGQRAQQVGLEPGERRDDPAAAAMAVEPAQRPLTSCFSIVAHRPYSCMACTSRSISSRLPVVTTDLPSSCTSSISFSAFFFA